MGPSVLHDLRIEGQDSHIHQILASYHCTLPPSPPYSFYSSYPLVSALLKHLNPLLLHHYVAGVLLSVVD